jgi:hypothetical protein
LWIKGWGKLNRITKTRKYENAKKEKEEDRVFLAGFRRAAQLPGAQAARGGQLIRSRGFSLCLPVTAIMDNPNPKQVAAALATPFDLCSTDPNSAAPARCRFTAGSGSSAT